MSFAINKEYARVASQHTDFGFSIDTVTKIAPVLAFLYEDWWKVELGGMQHLPKTGPALVVGNAGGVVPWAGLMLMQALLSDKTNPRKLNILCDMDWIEDERMYSFLKEIGFVPWSADNAKQLFANEEIVVVFPEGLSGAIKPYGERYRVRNFDWTKIRPAIDSKVPIVPLATVGPDESFPVGANLESIAKMLSLPAFPVTPFFPFLPFPLSLFSLPIRWKMKMLKPLDYKAGKSRDQVEETAKSVTMFAEGEVQAELNRLLRTRVKALF